MKLESVIINRKIFDAQNIGFRALIYSKIRKTAWKSDVMGDESSAKRYG